MKTEMTYMNDLTEVVGGLDVTGHRNGCGHSEKVPTGNRKREMGTLFFLTVYRDMVEYRCPKCGKLIWEEE